MSVTPVYEEYVSVFGSEPLVQYFCCTVCGTLCFDGRFALRYTGQSCCDPIVDEVELVQTKQTEFSTILGTWGRWCRKGICDLTDGGCKCKPQYRLLFRRSSKKQS